MEKEGRLCTRDIERLIDTGGDLAAALQASNGVKVECGSSHLTTRMIEALAFTKDFKTLRVIDLSFCNMDDKDVRTLAQSLPAGLESLSLWGNNIGIKGAKALAPGLPEGLKVLVLVQDIISDEGAEALAARLPRGLRCLGLEHNGIGNKGVQALAAGLPGDLQSLFLAGNSFGIEGAEALAASLPASLTCLELSRLSDEDEESLLMWLGKKEPLPVADVLLQFFFTPYGRAKCQDHS